MAGRCPVRLLGLQGLSEGRMIVKDEPSVLWTLRHGDDEVRWEGRLLPVGLEGRIVCRGVTSHESRGLLKIATMRSVPRIQPDRGRQTAPHRVLVRQAGSP